MIGIDTAGYCAGSGVYQIRSAQVAVSRSVDVLSAGVLGLFVATLSAGAKAGFTVSRKVR